MYGPLQPDDRLRFSMRDPPSHVGFFGFPRVAVRKRMNAGVEITYHASGRITDLERLLRDNTHGKSAAEAAGQGVVELLRDRFLSLESRGNKNGWPSQRFWYKAAQSTYSEVDPNGIFIGVQQAGVSFRFHGGTINMRDRLLAYAACAAAYGKRAREWAGLKFGWAVNPEHGHPQMALIAQHEGSHLVDKKGKAGRAQAPGTVMYWLARHITQRPNPEVIPTTAEILNAAKHAILQRLAAWQDQTGQKYRFQ